MVFIWDYIHSIHLRLTKAKIQSNHPDYDPDAFMNFLENAERDIGNLIAVANELREQRNYFILLAEPLNAVEYRDTMDRKVELALDRDCIEVMRQMGTIDDKKG